MHRRSDEEWRESARCLDLDPEMFFDDAKAAKAECRRCPVVMECLSWALSLPDQHGVAGALTERERRAIRGGRRRAALATTTEKETVKR